MVNKSQDTSYWETMTGAYHTISQEGEQSSSGTSTTQPIPPVLNDPAPHKVHPSGAPYQTPRPRHRNLPDSPTVVNGRNDVQDEEPPPAPASNRTRAALRSDSRIETKSLTGKVIVVTSGKGGVGKSTVALNLAIVCSQLKNRVLLMDGDLGLANINLLMGMIPSSNIFEVIKGEKNIRDVILETNMGIDIIPGASGVSQIANINQEQRHNLVAKFMDLSGYDIMIVDTGAGVSDNVLDFAVNADQALVVTTPEPTAIIDAYGMIKSIISVSASAVPIYLVINKVCSPFEAEQIYQRLLKITRQFLKTELHKAGYILEADTIKKSVLNLKPFISSHPHSKSSICIRNIGLNLLNVPELKSDRGIPGFFSKIFGK